MNVEFIRGCIIEIILSIKCLVMHTEHALMHIKLVIDTVVANAFTINKKRCDYIVENVIKYSKE
jgi:hypothetical protein